MSFSKELFVRGWFDKLTTNGLGRSGIWHERVWLGVRCGPITGFSRRLRRLVTWL